MALIAIGNARHTGQMIIVIGPLEYQREDPNDDQKPYQKDHADETTEEFENTRHELSP
jgi:hypothetical protein